MKVLVNGEFTDQIAVSDRGLQYGDGIFETMAFCHGELGNFDAHWQRLAHGGRVLGLPLPGRSDLLEDVQLLLDHPENSGIDKAVVKLILTRGSGERGYAPPRAPSCNRIFQLFSWPTGLEAQARDGIRVKFCATRLGLNPGLAGIKHLNRLEQVLASQEISDDRHAQGIMLDVNDQVIEATSSNIFIVENGLLVTPILDQCGVAGLARERVMQLAKAAGIEASIERVSCMRLTNADESFLCNSITGIVPVIAVGRQRVEIGPVTRKLQSMLRKGSRP